MGGGNVFIVGTHGGVGVAQCLPPDGTAGGSGAGQILCSICYGGTQSDTGDTVAECVAASQGYPCQDVIACTGSVSPRGLVATGGGGVCAEFMCDGVWVDGCDPPGVITPSVPGLCFTYGVTQPPTNPIPGGATVGCFAGDHRHDIWRRCTDRYRDWVVEDGTFWDTTCADIWADPQGMGDWRYQTCRDLVSTCIDDTLAVCAANGIAILD
jgi:hypothetical protein